MIADAVATRVVWLAAAKARDLATLRTLSFPEFKFNDADAQLLALLCSPKGTDLSNARGIVAKALVSDDVEALALLSWAFSWTPLERGWSVRDLAVSSKNVHVLEAVWKSVGPQGLKGMSPLMWAVATIDRELTNALLSYGSDIKWFSEGGCSALFLACFQGEEWLDVVEFLCRNLPPGSADLPAGVRQKGAVHWACESKSVSIVKVVLGRPEVVVNRIDENGHIGPFYAINRMSEADFAEMMRMFLDRGLDLNGDALSIIADLTSSWRPRMYSVMELLFQKGLDPLADVPGTGKKVWQFFNWPHPEVQRLYQTYCAKALGR
jgi:hypothetical protein